MFGLNVSKTIPILSASAERPYVPAAVASMTVNWQNNWKLMGTYAGDQEICAVSIETPK